MSSFGSACRPAGGRGGRNGFEHLLDQLGIVQKNSRPNHPTTCGKVERFHQTLKRWLAAQPATATITDLQTHVGTFVDHYNTTAAPTAPCQLARLLPSTRAHRRPPRLGPIDLTSGFVMIGSTPTGSPCASTADCTTSAWARTLDGTRVLALIHDPDVRVLHALTGQLIRHLAINPGHRYHGTGASIGGPRRPFGPRKTEAAEP